MNSALHVMLTTRRGIIVFIAHVTILDATAAYPNHIGHSVCLRNSMLFPYVGTAKVFLLIQRPRTGINAGMKRSFVLPGQRVSSFLWRELTNAAVIWPSYRASHERRQGEPDPQCCTVLSGKTMSNETGEAEKWSANQPSISAAPILKSAN